MDTMTRMRDLHRAVLVADGDDHLVEVACRMRDEDVDALLVMRGAEVAGVITDRDLVEAVADGTDLARAVAADFTRTMAATVELDTGLDEAARVLTDAAVRLLVVTDGGTPVGVVSARELLTALRP